MVSIQKTYRGDIDGLRAVAVLGVILFHAGIGFSGGFVGVDVFFVISGFLITKNIAQQLKNNKFSFISFYARRALRLLPALFFTFILCVIFGAIIFSPTQLSDFADSLIYSSLSISNIFFWLNTDYFSASAMTKPLLHTWSLSVEEQFYFAWPLLMVMSYRISNVSGIKILIFSILTLGIVASQLAVSHFPAAAYFLTPFRAFEFAFGGIVSLYSFNGKIYEHMRKYLFFIGIALILVPMITYTESVPFPGLMAIPPCLGAAIIISFGNNSRYSLLLDNKPMRFIGLISYSLYLIHWPVIVFYTYYISRELNYFDKINVILLTLIISLFTYYFIEKKFRFHNISLNKLNLIFIYMSFLAISIFTIVIGKNIIDNDGWVWRIDKKYNTLAKDASRYQYEQYGGHGYGFGAILGDKNKETTDAIMAGDSYANQYASGLDKLFKENGKRVDTLFVHGCMISRDSVRAPGTGSNDKCDGQYQRLLEKLKGNNTPLIISHSWDTSIKVLNDRASGKRISFKNNDEYYTYVIEQLHILRQSIGNRKLIIIGSLPRVGDQNGVVSCITRPEISIAHCTEKLTVKESEATSFKFNEELKKAVSTWGDTIYIDPYPLFCHNGICDSIINNKIYYSDGGHLSLDGSEAFADFIKPKLMDIL
ncbi:TPA: acyltransferase [Morganella morganii]|nr:acyltransferase [Morganella morganii]